jgi:hypothetical protein
MFWEETWGTGGIGDDRPPGAWGAWGGEGRYDMVVGPSLASDIKNQCSLL